MATRLSAEYLESEKGQEERSIEESFDRWVEDLDDMVREGKISQEDAKKQQDEMLESAVKGIETVRNEDGTLTVKFRAGGRLEMDWHLYTWGKHVTVVKPENWREMVDNTF